MGLIPQTEKGKITASILIAVLATTAIMVPVSIFTDRSIRQDETESIQTYSYKGDASTTGKAIYDIAGIKTSKDLTGDGKIDSNDSVVWLNEENSSFNEILEDKQMIDGVESTNGLGFGNRDAIGAEWEAGGNGHSLYIYDSVNDDGTINEHDMAPYGTTLNLNMKVPKTVADVLRGHLETETPSELTIDELNSGEISYGDFLKTNNAEANFAVAFGFYNYATYSKNAKTALDADFATDGLVGTKDSNELKDWFTTTFPKTEWNWKLGDEPTEIFVDGSSTPNAAMEAVIGSFNKDYILDQSNALTENLNNQGSSASWAGDSKEDIPGGPNHETNNLGSASTFLGTSSSLKDGYLNWGYEAGALKTETSSGIKVADETKITTSGAVMETTIGVAPGPQFFTSSSLKIVNPETGKLEQPMGITQHGIYDAYVYGASWQQLADGGQITFVPAA